MQKTLYLVASLAIICTFWACERPQSPNFKLDHKIQAPITVDKTYQFLGGKGALIDTTGEDFDSLFSTNNNGVISISKEEDFEFGSLDDAIPEVNVSATNINSSVSEIEIGDFTSGSSGNVGTASFQDITGLNPDNFSPGDNIPDANPSPTTNISLNTDNFESAVLSSDGSLELFLTNNLGFDIDQLNITLNAGSTSLGSTTVSPFLDEGTQTGSINLNAGDNLSNLNIDVNAVWSGKEMKRDPDNLIVSDVGGSNLRASEASAAVPSQEFNSSGTTQIDNSDFQFADADDYIQISSGQLSISDILNEIPLQENIDISFPDIRSDRNNYSQGDSLVISLTIPGAQNGASGELEDQTKDLSGFRIYADGNSIDYNIVGTTESTEDGTQSNRIRTIKTSQQFSSDIEIENLNISRAEGLILPKTVLINDDSNSDGNVDVYNENEAQTINISGISALSNQLSDITFANPTLNTIYSTNLGVKTTIYASIAGINNDGQTVYLNGDEGGEYHVAQQEIPSELNANNSNLDENQVIKFDLQTPTNGTATVKFDTARTNSSEFFSNLPSDIRFVGVARINDESEEGYIQDPVSFDPSLSVNLPFNVSAENATFEDTVDADLGDLPGQGDDRKLSQATLTINYTNGLPFRLDFSLQMLDKEGNQVTSYPLDSDDMVFKAASVNSNGFVEGQGIQDILQISFSEDQLDVLNQTRSMILDISFNTTQQQEVKIRAEDVVTIRMKMSVDVTSTVN